MLKKLRIRAITAGADFHALCPTDWERLKTLYDTAENMFGKAGIPVQTRRLALELLSPASGINSARLFSMLGAIAQQCDSTRIRWICLPISAEEGWGPEDLRWRGLELIRKYPFLFLHYLVGNGGGINLAALEPIARTVLAISTLSNTGFDNFRVGVGMNIAPGTPFFPFSWHKGESAYSLAVETLGPILPLVKKLKKSKASLDKIQSELTSALEKICYTVDSIGCRLEEKMGHSFTYRGMDISLSPFPDDIHSIAHLIELLGPDHFGNLGTASAIAFFTRIIKHVLATTSVRCIGFNGVMISPLEDKGMAERLKNNPIEMENFLLYSTVCGCGIDMIPIEGTTLSSSLATLYQDTWTLSSVHNKPLGVRVLPVPAGRINELTTFNHDFLVNTRIMGLRGTGLLYGDINEFNF